MTFVIRDLHTRISFLSRCKRLALVHSEFKSARTVELKNILDEKVFF